MISHPSNELNRSPSCASPHHLTVQSDRSPVSAGHVAVFAEVEADASLIGRHLAYLALARAYLDAYPELQNNAKAVHEFATTKLSLARRVRSGPHVATTRRRLYREALELLHRVVQLADSPARTAWAWFDIAKALARLRSPETEVRQACLRAIELLPEEPRFKEWLAVRTKNQGQ